MLRKCAVFYSAIGADRPPEKIDLSHIETLTYMQIKRDLNPVLRKGEKFDLNIVQKEVRDYLASVMVPTRAEENFWNAFTKRDYRPELIFGESQELRNILGHPMAVWKCRDK